MSQSCNSGKTSIFILIVEFASLIKVLQCFHVWLGVLTKPFSTWYDLQSPYLCQKEGHDTAFFSSFFSCPPIHSSKKFDRRRQKENCNIWTKGKKSSIIHDKGDFLLWSIFPVDRSYSNCQNEFCSLAGL